MLVRLREGEDPVRELRRHCIRTLRVVKPGHNEIDNFLLFGVFMDVKKKKRILEQMIKQRGPVLVAFSRGLQTNRNQVG